MESIEPFIKLVYSNVAPYDLTEVYIHGKLANPSDYEIRAKEGVIVLKYSLHRLEIELDRED